MNETWASTEQVCTTAVAVNDQTGNYCATKADGSYRCWGPDADSAPPLPKADYRRVHLTPAGPIGLKQDGSFTSIGRFQVPPNTPISEDFDSTDMLGYQTLCVLDGGRFALVTSALSDRSPFVTFQEGVFSTVNCAFEGILCGILTTGSVLCRHMAPPPGNDWQSLALSENILCGIRASGQVECHPSGTDLGCFVSDRGPCDDGVPRFPPGSYSQIAATGAVACALDTAGALACFNVFAERVLEHAGPFRTLDAGFDIVCGVLQSGTTLCYQQQPSGGFKSPLEIHDFVPIAPSAEEGY